MFDIDQTKQTLQTRLAEAEAEVARRTREVEEGMLVDSELRAATQQRDDARQRLADLDATDEAPQA